VSKSVRELALLAIVAALGADGTPATGGVFRSRLEQVGPDDLPCYDVTPGDQKTDENGELADRFSVHNELTVTVRGIVDAAVQEGGQASLDDSALDPFYVFAVQALTGDGANLGGIVESVEERGNVAVFQPAGRDVLGIEMTFVLQFATKRGDATTRG